jgi:hypothetical protein
MRNSKRPRATSGGNDEDSEEVAAVLDPISPSVLTREEDLYGTYRTAKPFPHCIIQNFCKPGFLGKCLYYYSTLYSTLCRLFLILLLLYFSSFITTRGRTNGIETQYQGQI